MNYTLLHALWNRPEVMSWLRVLPTRMDGSLDALLASFDEVVTARPDRALEVLELACGSARLSFELLRRHPTRLSVHAGDVNPAAVSMLASLGGGLRAVTLDATLPATWADALRVQVFDVIVSHGALRYFHNRLTPASIAGWIRVLSPGGTVLLSDVCTRAFDAPAAFARLIPAFRRGGLDVAFGSVRARVFEMSRFYQLLGAAVTPEPFTSDQLADLTQRAGFRDESVLVLRGTLREGTAFVARIDRQPEEGS